MINNATAYERLAQITKPVIWENKKILAYGMTFKDLSVWLQRQGFRTDTPRSTIYRWLETWIACRRIFPIPEEYSREPDRKLIWLELPAAISHMANSEAISRGYNQIYDAGGFFDWAMFEKINKALKATNPEGGANATK